MINYLSTDIPTYKYVDNMTLYTVTNDPSDGNLQTVVNTVLICSGENHMKINSSKPNKMLVTFSRPVTDVASITIDGCPLERVESMPLLGVKLSNDLIWDLHVAHILF